MKMVKARKADLDMAISPQYVDGLELRIRELEDELAEWKAKGSRGQIAQWRTDSLALAAEREVSDKLEKALKDTLSHLVAAASLLSRSPKTAAPSNKMFDQMVVDYKAAAKRARAAIRKKERGE